jgi:general secretion pathway protein L
MQSTLILFLNNYHEGILSWVELEDNIVKQTILAGEVSSLAEVTKDKTIIVMVPATDILLTSVVMPNLSSSKLRQALPFALEDQLVGEIDQLHFAIGEKTDTALSVAIIQKDKIQHWLQLLREWQVYPHAMYAMVFGLPCEINTWSLLASDDECLVRL